jgi:nucleoid-associated protein YgaU
VPAFPASGDDAVVLVAAGLGALVLARLVLGGLLRGLARGAGRAALTGRRVVAALRPGLARRVAAAGLGLSAPAAALHAAPAAGAAPVEVVEVVDAPARAAAQTADAATRPAPPASYTVVPGDSLWSIARDHLPARATDARVARAWPRWYAANRRVIGPDPSLIVPGQHLRVPGRRSAGTPTQPHAAPAPPSGTSVPSALSLDPDRR